MRTVKWLREELLKFPDNAVLFAYEGEVIGLIIEYPFGVSSPDPKRGLLSLQGVIYCGGSRERETELLPPLPLGSFAVP